MKCGFDLDGTLDHPEIRNLCNALFDAGHEVHILTGYWPTGNYTEQMKHDKIARLGVRYTQLHLCEGASMAEIGQTKAAILNRYGIEFMIDDPLRYRIGRAPALQLLITIITRERE